MRRRKRAFTLVEILVVIAIILLASVIALPAVYNALSGRQVDDAARTLTGMLAGARDAAVRYNAPRGLRLLPDPTLTVPALGAPNAGTLQLAYSRIVSIEPGGDYAEGRINIGPQYPFGTQTGAGGFPPRYPRGVNAGDLYPFPSTGQGIAKVLMVEESPFGGGFAWLSGQGGSPNPPTNWYWNVRVGEKIRIGQTGRLYTIVGPLTQSPWTTGDNFELFVNVGPPGTTPPLRRTYYAASGLVDPVTFTAMGQYNPEFLFLVNGEDDDKDGWVDGGWDGVNNNPPCPLCDPAIPLVPAFRDLVTDDLFEWETEAWSGGAAATSTLDQYPGNNSPSADFVPGRQGWVNENWQSGTFDVAYTIERKPVPSQGAREVSLPAGIVIDATGWNAPNDWGLPAERSRISPVVQAGSRYADIMVQPNGTIVSTLPYSAPTAASAEPCMHLWLTSAEDVHPIGSLWGMNTSVTPNVPNPNPNASSGQTHLLPLSADAIGPDPSGNLTTSGHWPPAGNPTLPVLKHDRRLVTIFSRTGGVVTNTIDATVSTNPLQPSEGMSIADPSQPFYAAQRGQTTR